MESTKKTNQKGGNNNKDPKAEVSTANVKDMKAVAASKTQESGGWDIAGDALFGFASNKNA